MDALHRHERFMQLFLPTQRGLAGYLRTLIPNPSDAEDVLQSAAAVMWEKFDEFRPETRFDFWAYHIARLQALRFLKDRKRSKLVFSDAVLDMLADRAITVSRGTGEMLSSLDLCVERLHPQDTELLRLRFEPGATNRSVAITTGRSESMVSRTLGRLYSTLLGCIERHTPTKSERQGEVS